LKPDDYDRCKPRAPIRAVTLLISADRARSRAESSAALATFFTTVRGSRSWRVVLPPRHSARPQKGAFESASLCGSGAGLAWWPV